MWSVVQAGNDSSSNGGGFESPNARSKHSAVATPSGFIYVQGGRSGNLPLKDIWKFDPVQSQWEEVQCRGNRPPCLQEHTMVAWKTNIYVFGGEVGFAYTGETPLWILDTGTAVWRKHHLRGPGVPPQPSGRRGHSGVVYGDAMHVYGGYQDLRGSSPELWTFDFLNETWLCQYPSPNGGGNGVSSDQQQPAPRHNHSAVVYDGFLWVYGGMTDLQARGDFWRWHFESKQWSRVRGGNRNGPGDLHSHTAISVMGSMYLFGGERGGILLGDLWRFHFATEMWERIQAEGILPNPRCRHVAIPNPLLGDISGDARTAGGGGRGRLRAWEADENVPDSRRKTPTSGGVNKSISMCFGQSETAVNETGSARRPFKFRVHPVRLCSKNTASDDDDDNDDSYVATYNRQTAQVNISRRLRDKLSRSSRLVRSISSGNYSTVLQESLATFGGPAGNVVVGELERLVEETPPSLHRMRRPIGHPLPKSQSSDAVLESDSENSTPRHLSSQAQPRPNPNRRTRPLSEGAKDCCCFRGGDFPSVGCPLCRRPRNGYDGPLVTAGDFEEDDENLVVIPGQVDVRNACKSPIRIPITGPLIDLGELPPTPPLTSNSVTQRLDVAVIGATVTTHSATSRGSTRMSNSTSRSSGYLSATNADPHCFKDDIVEIDRDDADDADEDDDDDDGLGVEPLSLLDTSNPQPRHKDFAATLASETGASFDLSAEDQHRQRQRQNGCSGLLLELKTFTPTHDAGTTTRPLEELQNKKERARSWDRVSKRREMAVAPSRDESLQRRSWIKDEKNGKMTHSSSQGGNGSQGLWTRSPCLKARLQHHNWQLCMYMCGGREQGAPNVSRQPLIMWRLYV